MHPQNPFSDILYQIILDAIEYPIFIKDHEHRWIFVNKKWCILMKGSREKFLGKTDYDFYSSAEADLFYKYDDIVFNTKLSNENQESLTINNKKHWYLTRKSLFQDPPHMDEYLLGIMFDITKNAELEQSILNSQDQIIKIEQKFHDVLEFSQDCVYRVNLTSHAYDYLSPSIERITGYTIAEIEQMGIAGFHSLILPEDQHILSNISPTKDYQIEFRIKTKNGSIRWITDTKTIFYTQDTHIPYSMIGTLRDITKQKNLELEQLRIQKFESIGLLAGGIAHDYNNILVSILGNIQLLQLSEHLTEEQRDILTELQTATMHATDLTRQLLTFAKGGKPVRKLESMLRIIEDSASFVLRSSKCRYACQLEDVIPLVNVDKAQMMQVMNNLLINAVQAMPEGGMILITLSLIDTAFTNEIPLKTGKFVKIAIKDHGVGISKENQVKMFDLYFTTKEGGSGLGLPTSYSILKNHNGYLTFESLEHQGSTFYVYLPATEEFSGVEPIPTEFTTALQNQRLKILVMDDNLEVHTYLRRILPKLNCEMTSCYNGQEAVDAYRRAFDQKVPYSLVIMDLLVPGGMGGKEATTLIRKIHPDAKIIVSSGYANDPIIANYQENGFDGILAKPYTIEDLKKIFEI